MTEKQPKKNQKIATQEREKIFMVHLKPITLQDDLKTDDVAKRMASLTPGFVGADIVTWWHWELGGVSHPDMWPEAQFIKYSGQVS